MRILYVHYKPPRHRPGGMEVHISSVATALRSSGHEVHVFPILRENVAERRTTASVERKGRSQARKQFARFGYEPRCFARYPLRAIRFTAALRRIRPDVILLRYEPLEWAETIVARILGIPLTLEVNAVSQEIRYWKSSEIYLYPFTDQLERRVLDMAGGILTVSSELKRLLVQSGLSNRKISVNPNGADIKAFSPSPANDALRRELGLNGFVVIGFVGSFARWHSIHSIINVMPKVLTRYPRVAFLFAGGSIDDLEPELQSKIVAMAGVVQFTGPFPVTRAPDYLSLIDIALSLYPHIEPFTLSPLKLFEYMAAGKAIVATDIGQQSEILTDHVDAILVPPEDDAALASALLEVLEQPELRHDLGNQARDTVERGYTWQDNASRIVRALQATTGKCKTERT